MSHPEVLIDSIYGNCPVQAEGTIDGFHFYFRARGERWSLSIANGKSADPLEEDGWHYSEHYGDSQFAAGWMEEAEALKFIHEAAERFHAKDLERACYMMGPAKDGLCVPEACCPGCTQIREKKNATS